MNRLVLGAALALTILAIGLDARTATPTPTTFPSVAPSTVVLRPATTTPPTTAPTTTTSAPVALVGPDTPCQQWVPEMLEAGWPADRDILETALGIMWRESRCQPGADSGADHGLFQINRFWSSDKSNPPNWLAAQGIAQTHDDLFDPMTNLKAAWAIAQYSMDRNGVYFAPWTTWSAGS